MRLIRICYCVGTQRGGIGARDEVRAVQEEWGGDREQGSEGQVPEGGDGEGEFDDDGVPGVVHERQGEAVWQDRKEGDQVLDRDGGKAGEDEEGDQGGGEVGAQAVRGAGANLPGGGGHGAGDGHDDGVYGGQGLPRLGEHGHGVQEEIGAGQLPDAAQGRFGGE